MILRSLTLSILFILPTLGSECQELYFRHYDFADQYSGLNYNLLFEDQQHLLWVGTSQGLFSFDGIRFKSYLFPESAGSQDVSAVFQDLSGKLWIGLANGWIGTMKNDSIRTWNIQEGHPKVRIVDFAQTFDGTIWIATYGEGLYFHSGNILYNINQEDGLKSNDIYTMGARKDEVLIGTDAGIHLVDYKNKTKSVRHIGKDQGLPDEIVKAISQTQSDIWFGSFDKGIYSLTGDSIYRFQQMDTWTYGEIHAIANYGNQEIWIGTDSKGLYCYNRTTSKLNNVPIPGPESTQITDLLADQEGNIWVLNKYSGIYIANRHFELLTSQVHNLQALYRNDQFGLVLGNPEGVFHLEANATHQDPVPLIEGINVLSLWADEYGRLWVGTFGQGLYCIDPVTKQYKSYHKKHGLTDESILSIAGKGRKMWLATLGGVTEVTLPAEGMSENLNTRNYNLEHGLGTNFIYSCYVDKKDRVWFGTDGKGLSVLENNNITNYPMADTIPLESVYSITESANGTIWFSTDQEGVFSFSGDKFEHYGFEEGLRHLEISSLIGDSEGKILASHNGGIDLIDPVHKAILYYGDELGLHECRPNLNASFRDTDGTIWIGCAKGIIKYVPYGNFRYTPRTTMLDVSVYLEHIPWKEKTSFRHNENYLSFNYAGLWYSDPKTVNYRYRLEGLDIEWKNTREQRITYHRLPPGEYVFRLQSGFGDAFVGESELRYAFKIRKPWYATNLFFIALFIFTGLAIYLFVKLRERRLERAEQLKRQQIEHELLTLQSQINPHFLFNSFNTLASIIEESPSTAVEYTENLSDFFRNILQYRSQNLIPLNEELNIARNFAYLLQRRFGENLKFNITHVGTDKLIPPLTLQILIENAVKHNIISKNKPLHVDIYMNGEDYLHIENDLQKKSIAENSTHYGLQSILNRYKYLSKRPVIIKEEKTKFIVKIPLINQSES